VTLILDVGKFNRLLSPDRPGLGQHVLWGKATACPCRSPTSGAAQPGCPVCFGKGTFYDQDVPAWTGLSGQRIQRQWAAFGTFEMGDTVVTIPSDSPMYGLGETDRITFTDSSEPFSQVVLGGVDYLPFIAASIDRVVWRDAVTRLAVLGDIPTQAPDKTLTWAANGPPAGVQYSVSGRRNPQYFVFVDFPQDRAHSGGLALPRRVVLRKYSLAAR
jgi:hypothetical protein